MSPLRRTPGGIPELTPHAGEIIFGGINRWKFSGPLEPVAIWPPIEKQDPNWLQYVALPPLPAVNLHPVNNPSRYWINVTSIGSTPPTNTPRVYTSKTFNMPMLIDSGSTLSYIREDIVQVVGKELARPSTPTTTTGWIASYATRTAPSISASTTAR